VTGPQRSQWRIRFGPYEVDLRAGEVRKNGTKVRLQDQPFRLLQILLEQPGEVITREELQKQIWPEDTFVAFDTGLNNAIKRLREALGETADTSHFIETLPRRGYRFIGKLDSVSEQFHSLAVLPLENLSGDPEQEYFADGLTEAFITNLAKVSSLRVISRTTTMHYKGVRRALPEITRELGVDTIVEGTVQRSEDRVRVSVRLIDARTDAHIWAETYDRDLRDVLALQSDVAQAIMREVEVKLAPHEQAQFLQVRPVNSEAYVEYLKGRYHWNKRNLEGLTKGAEYFQKAVDRDPTYAAAYAGLADSASRLGFWTDSPPEEGCLRGKAAALKAIAMDDSLSEAYAALCFATFHYDFNIPAAELAAKRAIELDPHNAFALQGRALCLVAKGQAEAAVTEILRAAQLEPLSIAIQWTAAVLLYFARQYDQSISQTYRILEIDPKAVQARWILSMNLVQKGKYDDAVEKMEQAVQASGAAPFYLGSLGYIYGTARRRDDAIKVIEELHKLSQRRHVSSHWIGLIYAALDEKDEAFLWLDRSYQERAPWLVYAKAHPWLDNLRSDSRFYCLLQRMNIPI
jgi:TolB-like protein/Flp pilus assembly protein TadD